MLQFSNCRDWSDTEFDYENENVTHKSTQFTDGKLQEMKNEQEKIGLGVGMGEENIQKLPWSSIIKYWLTKSASATDTFLKNT